MTRFADMVTVDIFQLSTVLDPCFGLSAFDPCEHNCLKLKLKQHMILVKPAETVNPIETLSPKISSNYVFFSNNNQSASNSFDDYDSKINAYLDLVTTRQFPNALDFWRCHE